MELKIYIADHEYDPDFQELTVELSELNDFQINVAANIIENKLHEIYVPMPVCGGDMFYGPDGTYGWVSFDDFNLELKGNSIFLHFPLYKDLEIEEEKQTAVDWMVALPAVKPVLRPIIFAEEIAA